MFPANPSYQASVASYWSNLAQLSPTCIVQPITAEDISIAVKTLVKANKRTPCSFAVRGGGHTPWGGSSNIQNGVTIDLSLLNKVEYNRQKSTASIGPGTRWVDVYRVLDQLGVSVPGGRAGSVGVAGLTLGGEDTALSPQHPTDGLGGNSFFAARYGLVCDNVVNYEVRSSPIDISRLLTYP